MANRGARKFDGFGDRLELRLIPEVAHVSLRIPGVPAQAAIHTAGQPAGLGFRRSDIVAFLQFVGRLGEADQHLVALENPSPVVGRPGGEPPVLLVNNDMFEVWGG